MRISTLFLNLNLSLTFHISKLYIEVAMENADMARGRSLVYKLLSRVFLKEVSSDFLEMLKKKEVRESLKGLQVDLGKILDGKSKDKLIDELATEYTALFLTPGGMSPHESVRFSGLLFQEPASMVAEFYKTCGLVIPEDYKGFPDQLGVELEFMSYLAEKEAEAWQSKNAAAEKFRYQQKRFLREHLGRWVVDFCKETEEVTFHQFYKEMIGLTRRFMETEIEELIEVVENANEQEKKNEGYGYRGSRTG